jgi:hypothetical protein
LRLEQEDIVTSRIILTALAASAVMGAASPATQTIGDKLQITALAVDMSNMSTGATATVEFNVDRWSTEREREALIATMVDKGQDALLSALQKKLSHGKMRFPAWQGRDPLNARLGWDIRYASQMPTDDGGRRIVLALDRYIGFWEARNRPRTIDYPFTFIEIHVDKDGRGEGKMSIATRVNFDKKKNVIELETYASEPVRLQNVRVTSRT